MSTLPDGSTVDVGSGTFTFGHNAQGDATATFSGAIFQSLTLSHSFDHKQTFVEDQYASGLDTFKIYSGTIADFGALFPHLVPDPQPSGQQADLTSPFNIIEEKIFNYNGDSNQTFDLHYDGHGHVTSAQLFINLNNAGPNDPDQIVKTFGDPTDLSKVTDVFAQYDSYHERHPDDPTIPDQSTLFVHSDATGKHTFTEVSTFEFDGRTVNSYFDANGVRTEVAIFGSANAFQFVSDPPITSDTFFNTHGEQTEQLLYGVDSFNNATGVLVSTEHDFYDNQFHLTGYSKGIETTTFPGTTHVYTLDAAGNLTSEEDFSYDVGHQLVADTIINNHGQETKQTVFSAGGSVNHIENEFYDSSFHLIGTTETYPTTTFPGTTSIYSYNPAGQLTSQEDLTYDAGHHLTSDYTFNPNGKPSEVWLGGWTYSNGLPTHFYQPNWDGLGFTHVQDVRYDASGNELSVTDTINGVRTNVVTYNYQGFVGQTDYLAFASDGVTVAEELLKGPNSDELLIHKTDGGTETLFFGSDTGALKSIFFANANGRNTAGSIYNYTTDSQGVVHSDTILFQFSALANGTDLARNEFDYHDGVLTEAKAYFVDPLRVDPLAQPYTGPPWTEQDWFFDSSGKTISTNIDDPVAYETYNVAGIHELITFNPNGTTTRQDFSAVSGIQTSYDVYNTQDTSRLSHATQIEYKEFYDDGKIKDDVTFNTHWITSDFQYRDDSVHTVDSFVIYDGTSKLNIVESGGADNGGSVTRPDGTFHSGLGLLTSLVVAGNSNGLFTSSGASLISHDGGSLIGNDGSSLVSTAGSQFIASSPGLVSANGQVISNDGGSLISQDGSTIVSAGGGNLISHDGGSLISQDGSTIVSAGGGNIVSAGGGNIVSAGGGNLISQDGSNIVSAGGGNIVSAGGGNIVSAGGGNIVSAGGGNFQQR